jgi:hypothetical protein
MSTLKVDTLDTSNGTGNITLSRPLSGSGASLTSLPAANLTGTIDEARISVLTASKLTGTVADARISTLTASKLTGALPAISGASLTDTIYDISFTAGFDSDMVKEDVAVATYGEMVMARAGTFVGEAGYIDTVATGAVCTIDIQKNGSAIYGSGSYPIFAAGSNTLTAGTISVTTFSANDRLTFKIVGIGSSAAGQGIRFTLKCKV